MTRPCDTALIKMMADRWVVLYHLQSTFNPHNSPAKIVLLSLLYSWVTEAQSSEPCLRSHNYYKDGAGPTPSSQVPTNIHCLPRAAKCLALPIITFSHPYTDRALGSGSVSCFMTYAPSRNVLELSPVWLHRKICSD